MKKCDTCKRTDVQFGKNKSKIDGLQSRCKECDRIRGKKYYRDNPQQQEAAVKRSKKRLEECQNRICEYLTKHPCVDCGEANIVLLEFDHVNSTTKTNNISVLLSKTKTWNKILLEIEKCVVRCANCHRIKTAHQFGNYRLKWLSILNVE